MQLEIVLFSSFARVRLSRAIPRTFEALIVWLCECEADWLRGAPRAGVEELLTRS